MITYFDESPPQGVVSDILTYPFRGGGKWLLLIGTILGVASDLAALAPLLGIIATLLLAGYFCAIYFEIIQTSATGSTEAPHFPELSNIVEDILIPWGKTFVVGLVCFLPLILFVSFAPEQLQTTLWHLSMMMLGACYFPMAMMAVVVLGSLAAISPHIVLPAIVRSGRLYWLAVFVIALLFMLNSVVGDLLANTLIVRSLVGASLSMIALMINGRILGIIFRDKQAKLGWI